MNLLFYICDKFNLLNNTLHFYRKHFIVIIGLGLIAAFGRVIQLEAFGQIAAWYNIVLEVVIESSRILLFLYVLGLANVKNGVIYAKHLFSNKYNRKASWSIAIHKLKKQWLSVFVSIIGFLLIAWCINYLIGLLAYETCLYLNLKNDGILSQSSSEWTILLFFKNLTVIPFTLIFDAILILWLSNRLSKFGKITLAQ